MAEHDLLLGQVRLHLQHLNYTYIQRLSSGAFGDVLCALSPTYEPVAVKVITNRNAWDIEDEIWPVLKHGNILPVLEMISIERLQLKLYVSPRHPMALDQMVASLQFKEDPNCLRRVKKWFKDIQCALHYLHGGNVCHLDMKADNVLISGEDRAVLCDFSGLNLAEFLVTRLVSPYEFRPPECFQPGANLGVRGKPFDIWTLGLCALNVLTGRWPSDNMNQPIDQNWTWEQCISPILDQALEPQMFFNLMSVALPCIQVTRDEAEQARGFVLSTLRRDPNERPTAEALQLHPFLRAGNGSLPIGPHENLPVPARGRQHDRPLPTHQCRGDCMGPHPMPHSSGEGKKKLGKRIKHWVAKKWNKIFRPKKRKSKHVADDSCEGD